MTTPANGNAAPDVAAAKCTLATEENPNKRTHEETETLEEAEKDSKRRKLPSKDQVDSPQKSLESVSIVSPEKERQNDEATTTTSEQKDSDNTTTTSNSGFGAFSGKASGFAAFASSNTVTTGFAAATDGDKNSTGFGSTTTSSFGAFATNGGGFRAATGSTSAFGESSSSATSFGTATVTETLSASELASMKEYQHVNGEENEKIIFSIRAKLYKMHGEEWRECGVGPLRLLEHTDTPEQVRLVMRRETHANGPGTKVILNTWLSACQNVERKGEKSLLLCIVEPVDDKPSAVSYLVRVGQEEAADNLQHCIDIRRSCRTDEANAVSAAESAA